MKKTSIINFSEDQPGPYYDPCDYHLHNWKGVSSIKNFSGEQNPHNPKITKVEVIKNGMYCCICHKRRSGFISIPINGVSKIDYTAEYTKGSKFVISDKTSKNFKTNTPLHKDNMLLYKINEHVSLFVNTNTMTHYQKFRNKNPTYKQNISFILNNNLFDTNYYKIETEFINN